MKKYILFLLALFCISLNAIAQVQPTDTDGDGYINISTLDHLRWVSENSGSWASNFELDNNINAAATASWNNKAGFSPIGNGVNYFTGKFEGNGFAIDSMYINRPDSDYIGLFGRTYESEITNVGMTNCRINGKDSVGGIVGYNDNYSTVKNSYNTGIVSGGVSVGGIVGYNKFSSISFCYTICKVKGGRALGGIVGYNYNSKISNSYSTDSVAGVSAFIGGIVGYNDNSTISNSYSTGNVSGRGYVGGLVGMNVNSTVSKCYNTGNIFGPDVYGTNAYGGGLIGMNVNSTVNNSYSTGSVRGLSAIGGLVGENGDTSRVNNCYSTGFVFGSSQIGGLIGVQDYFSNSSYSFWDKQTSGQSTSSDGTGKTTAEMKTKLTFTSAGWDFDSTWAIAADYNDGYPNLDGKNDPNGVKEIYSGSWIYPQPAMDEIFIRLSDAIDEPANVKLYDQAGQLALAIEATTNDGLIRLNTSALASGVYRVLINIDGKTYSEKVVVTK